VREAVHDRFYDPADCSYVNGSQACQAIALVANVPPAPLRAAVEARLEREIHAKGGHIHAGITGGAFLFKALMEARRDDLIYSMVSKTTYPSWGYMLANGATTLWEGWRETHSLLHSSFLYVGAWFIQGVLGIQPDPKRDGFKKFVVHPAGCDRPELTWARGHYDSIHGRIAVSWKRSEGVFSLTLCVPPNTEARVCLPCAESGIVLEGGRCLAEMADVRVAGREGGRLILEVGSGDYCFTAPIANAPLTLSGPAAPVPAR
jgi:alpha-L-rhamnosidase